MEEDVNDDFDRRNARGSDPWTSLEGTAGISETHLKKLAQFLRDNDRLAGWTTGEIRDSAIGLEHPNIWRRASDLDRDGVTVVLRDSAGDLITRVDRATNRRQRARRIAEFEAQRPIDWPGLWRLARFEGDT